MVLSPNLLLGGALLAGTAVALGAFGTHGLQGMIGEHQLSWWQTAVQYQMWHALALVALASADLPRVRLVAALLGTGAVLFSGTLYLMALTDWHWLGAITPAGGAAMISGWCLLAWTVVRHRRASV